MQLRIWFAFLSAWKLAPKDQSRKGIVLCANYIDCHFELAPRTKEQVADDLLKAIDLLGLSDILASPLMLPSIRDAFYRKTGSLPHVMPFSALNTPLGQNTPATQTEAAGKRSFNLILPRIPAPDGFPFPSKVARVETPAKVLTPTANSFELLDSMDTSVATSDKSTMNTCSDAKSSDSKSSKTDLTSTQENTSSSEKPQPIFIKAVPDYKDLLHELSQLSLKKFSKKVIDDLIRISPASIDNYRLIQRFLIEKNHKFYAMKPKGERPKKIVIRGLPTDTDISDIKSELCELGFDIHRISPMRNFRTKKAYPNFIIDVFKNAVLPGD